MEHSESPISDRVNVDISFNYCETAKDGTRLEAQNRTICFPSYDEIGHYENYDTPIHHIQNAGVIQ